MSRSQIKELRIRITNQLVPLHTDAFFGNWEYYKLPVDSKKRRFYSIVKVNSEGLKKDYVFPKKNYSLKNH